MSTTMLTLLTHGGKLHCDDALAYATLRLALDLSSPGHDHRLIRTRDKVEISAADIVFDVGGVHVDAVAQMIVELDQGATPPAGNPASAVRGPKHSVRTGKTPVLDAKRRASCSTASTCRRRSACATAR